MALIDFYTGLSGSHLLLQFLILFEGLPDGSALEGGVNGFVLTSATGETICIGG